MHTFKADAHWFAEFSHSNVPVTSVQQWDISIDHRPKLHTAMKTWCCPHTHWASSIFMLLLQQTKPPVCTRYFLSTLPAAAHTWDSTDDSAEHHAGADKQQPAHTQGCISTLVQYCSGFRVRKRNQQHILQTTDRKKSRILERLRRAIKTFVAPVRAFTTYHGMERCKNTTVVEQLPPHHHIAGTYRKHGSKPKGTTLRLISYIKFCTSHTLERSCFYSSSYEFQILHFIFKMMDN